jgi:2-methylisocitrate lyase-like PEP mutase family enzyme
MNREEKYLVFKQLHERPGAFVIPNPWNAGSAKILASLGFEALATTSSGYAFSAGHRDSVSEITRQGVLDNAREIAEATDLPVSADLLNGFGDSPEACAETITLAAEAGLAGGSIEDSTDDEGQPIFEFGLAVERVAAAVEAARGRNFLLTARAENFLHGRPDLNDTIRRLQAFEAAGADVLYAPGLSSLEEIREVCAAVSKPVNVLVGLKGTSLTVDALADAGVSRISVGGAMALAALGAFMRAAREIREQGTFTYGADALSHADASQFMT